MPRYYSEEEYEEDIDNCELALNEYERERLEMPGRGYRRVGCDPPVGHTRHHL